MLRERKRGRVQGWLNCSSKAMTTKDEDGRLADLQQQSNNKADGDGGSWLVCDNKTTIAVQGGGGEDWLIYNSLAMQHKEVEG